MTKSRELVMLEESLRDFIIDTYRNDEREKENFNAFRYRGLTVIIDNITRGSIPTFTVQIAILQAEFSIDAGRKIGGGLGSADERMIEQWLERGSNRQLMRVVWEGKTDEKFMKIKPFDMF